MFYSIKGYLAHLDKDFIVVENGGIGYKIFTSQSTMSDYSGQSEVYVHTQLVVREDDIYIVGFSSSLELEIFNHLRAVNGIGVKSALTILSFMSISSLVANVVEENSKQLVKIPGIGAKTAQRIIVELKDLFKKNYSAVASHESEKVQDTYIEESADKSQAVLALRTLGFSQNEIEEGLSGLDLSGQTLEDIIKIFLKGMKKA